MRTGLIVKIPIDAYSNEGQIAMKRAILAQTGEEASEYHIIKIIK
jgi:hypothetical protein